MTLATPIPAPPPPAMQPWHRRLARGIVALSVLAALLVMAGVGVLGVRTAQEQLAAARLAKAAAVAHAVQRDLDRALGYGIPLDRVEGVTAYLEGIAARNPDLHALLVTGPEGWTLHAAGPGRAGTVDAASAVRLPLRGGPAVAGHLLVAIDPGSVRAEVMGELVGVGLGMAAVLLLVAELAAALMQTAVRAPLDRLVRAMAAGAAGDFRTFLGRRPRDQIGRALLAFNAAVFHLHDRRQRFAAHADEVRSAVFDPTIAAEVERTRDRTLQALGDGTATPPQRVVEPRPGDARACAALLSAATAVVCLGGPPLALAPAALAGIAAAWAVTPAWMRAGSAAAALAVGAAALVGFPTLAAAGGGFGLALAWRTALGAGEGWAPAARPILVGAVAALLWGAARDWQGGVAEPVALAAMALVAARSITKRS